MQKLARYQLILCRFLLVSLVFTATQCTAGPEKLETAPITFTHPDGSTSAEITVELAKTDRERAKGLMYRKSLGDNEGMLFLFPEEKVQGFWMKNTYISLDMIFIDKTNKVVGILEKVPALNEKRRSVKPASQLVLELNAGGAARHGIVVGSRLNYSE